MASTTGAQRPSILVTVITLVVVIVVGLLVLQWVTGLIVALIRLAVVLAGIYLIARVGWYLLRKGNTA